jgi:nucleotide-binding universal stress UspA family protein
MTGVRTKTPPVRYFWETPIMKHILIATDFSPAARDATQYGIKLAEAFEARVTLVTAFEEIPIPAGEAMNIITNNDMRSLAQRQLEKEKHRISGDTPLPIDTLLKKGPVVRAVLAAATETHADLIVVGMTGTEKDIRRSFGSAATTLAQKTPVPLLVIPEEAKYTPPIAIAIAEDVVRDKGNETPGPVRELLEKFHAKLFVIRVFNKQSGEVIEILHEAANGNRTVGAFSPLYEIPANKHVAQALENFIEMNPISILVMQPQPHTLAEKWFLRSNTKEMIFETSIPLLILPPHVRTHSSTL